MNDTLLNVQGLALILQIVIVLLTVWRYLQVSRAVRRAVKAVEKLDKAAGALCLNPDHHEAPF